MTLSRLYLLQGLGKEGMSWLFPAFLQSPGLRWGAGVAAAQGGPAQGEGSRSPEWPGDNLAAGSRRCRGIAPIPPAAPGAWADRPQGQGPGLAGPCPRVARFRTENRSGVTDSCRDKGEEGGIRRKSRSWPCPVDPWGHLGAGMGQWGPLEEGQFSFCGQQPLEGSFQAKPSFRDSCGRHWARRPAL